MLSFNSNFVDSEAVILPEDLELAGFVPLLSLSYSPVYVSSKVEKVSQLFRVFLLLN
jgi:hypothetical protein